MTENEVTSPTNEGITNDTATQQLAEQMAAPIIQQHKRDKKFYARNRSATKRMNRPEKLEKMNLGGAKIMAVLDRNVYAEGRGA